MTPNKNTRDEKTWRMTIPAGQGLPSGEVMVTRSTRPRRKGDSVHAVYVILPSRGEVAAKTRAFDDGAVVVEFDSRNRIIGIELLCLKNPSKLKQFGDFADNEATGEVAQVFWTAHHIWHDVQLITNYLKQEGEEPDPDVFKRAHPSASLWRGQKDDRLALT